MNGALEERPMIYVTQLNLCPVGCGMGLIFLKSMGSGRIYLHCTSCGLAWDRPPAPNVYTLDIPETFAPKGTILPSREEIDAAGLGDIVATEEPDENWLRDIWRLRAKMFLEAGDARQAVAILTEVIDTWYDPPPIAYSYRAVAYRSMGDVKQAEEDEKVAKRIAAK